MRLQLAGHVAKFGGPARIEWPCTAPITAPPVFRLPTVAGVTNLTPHMRRIRLAGADLLRFDTMRAMHCRLFLTPPGATPVWPSVDAEERTSFGDGIVRKYTFRAVDVAAGWVDIDFVIHAEAAGPGSDWGAGARVGDSLGLIGPGGGGIGLDRPVLMAGDETALPAIARAIEAMPADATAHAPIEIADAGEEQPIDAPPGELIDWLHRGTAAPGFKLADAVADLTPDKETPVWASWKFAGFHTIRTDLRGRLDHPRERHLVTSYWRAGMAADRMEQRQRTAATSAP